MADDLVDYPVKCHCGTVRGRFKVKKGKVVAWDCNCSDCNMRKNVHVIVPEKNFSLEMGDTPLEEVTTLYQWGTKTAVRRFCKTCGEFNNGNVVFILFVAISYVLIFLFNEKVFCHGIDLAPILMA
jgi:hypothetical protein